MLLLLAHRHRELMNSEGNHGSADCNFMHDEAHGVTLWTVLSVKVLDVGRGSSVAPIRELCTLLSPVRTVQYVVFVTFPPCKTTVRCSIGSVPILNPKSWAPSSWCNFSHDLLPESFAFSA